MDMELDSKFVAYVDVLGYKSIIEDSASDVETLAKFKSSFECLIYATQEALADDPGYDCPWRRGLFRSIAFSDSLFIWTTDLIALLSLMQHLYASVYLWLQRVYNDMPYNWIPFIKGGIAAGWVQPFLDPTVKNTSNKVSVYRNPVGPGIHHVHQLVEKRACLSGMRCCLERMHLEGLDVTEILNPNHYTMTRGNDIIHLVNVPKTDQKDQSLDLVEIAWPSVVIRTDNCGFWEPLISAQRQFSPSALRHYSTTKELFRRSVPLEGNEEANRILAQRLP